MQKVIVRAPVRADLAGGTLDLWPLYLFHPGSRTVNVAISCYAESEIAETGDGAIEIHLTDSQHRARYDSLSELGADPKAALIHRVLEHFRMTGIRIVTRTDAPRGSGLGGSSALAVTLVRGMSELTGSPVEGDDLIVLVRDLETRLLGLPAGIQDYYPAVFGGLASIHLDPGRITRKQISAPLQQLASHLMVHYSGVAHFSGTNNWQLYKRHVEGKKKVRNGLRGIATAALEMDRALETGNFEAAGAALRHEWEQRKVMIDGISTPEVDSAIEAAIGAGAWGGKACGAGGGGCIVFLLPPDRREAVARALTTVPGRTMDVVPVAGGVAVSHESGAQTSSSRSRPAPVASSTLEQLYVSGGKGHYRPYLLAESIVTHVESRSGLHHATSHGWIAPVSPADGGVLWQQASMIDPEALDLAAVPDPDRSLDIETSPETLLARVASSEDSFRHFLEENVRLQLFHNPALSLYSEPAETREAFFERCMEIVNREIEQKRERLESTFRRRIDQLRERSEKEDRDLDKRGEEGESERQELNVAWGRALYNITSGRPAAAADTSVSVREVDYLDRIREIQRAWDRELAAARDELTAKASAIEEIRLVPAQKNIEITKYVLVWAAGLA
jgi:D-glycero-alpha-D-manno-heptose-7-phosphate kinase